MANQEHVDILKQGVKVWNRWREECPDMEVDLRKVDLNGSDLQDFNLSYVKLDDANLFNTDLHFADLRGASLKNATLSLSDLSESDISSADLREAELINTFFDYADLSDTNLQEADLTGSNLGHTNFIRANLRGANLSWSNLSWANLDGADIRDCQIHAIAAWHVQLKNSQQSDLIITKRSESIITVDNLEIAQFIYLLLNNQKIRDVIDTIAKKVILILGRFTPERKPVLDALRDELREHNFSPVIFDFEPSAKRDLTETISILAHLSRFVIADLTDAKGLPQELQAIVPHLPSVPIQPILHTDATEYAMFEHYEHYPWVLPIYRYRDIPNLLASIKEHIIMPVEQKKQKREKTEELEEKVRILEQKIKELEKHK